MAYEEENAGKYVVAEANDAKELFEGLSAHDVSPSQIVRVANNFKTAVYTRAINGE